MIVLAAACDDKGTATSLFIVSAPTALATVSQCPPTMAILTSSSNLHTNINADSSTDAKNKQVKGILKPGKPIIQSTATLSPQELRVLNPDHAVAARRHRAAKIRFADEVMVCDTFATSDYSRKAIDFAARQLTPALALAIKKELNEVKAEMDVHELSRVNTQFYRV